MPHCFPKWLYHCAHLSLMYECSSCMHPCQHLELSGVWILDFLGVGLCTAISYHGFNLHFFWWLTIFEHLSFHANFLKICKILSSKTRPSLYLWSHLMPKVLGQQDSHFTSAINLYNSQCSHVQDCTHGSWHVIVWINTGWVMV